MGEQALPTLLQPVTSLKGIGEQVAEKLSRLGITQVQDLLFHLPLRYQDRTRIRPIGSLVVGQEVMIEQFMQRGGAKMTFGNPANDLDIA